MCKATVLYSSLNPIVVCLVILLLLCNYMYVNAIIYANLLYTCFSPADENRNKLTLSTVPSSTPSMLTNWLGVAIDIFLTLQKGMRNHF